jgi:tellurite resistance protein
MAGVNSYRTEWAPHARALSYGVPATRQESALLDNHRHDHGGDRDDQRNDDEHHGGRPCRRGTTAYRRGVHTPETRRAHALGNAAVRRSWADRAFPEHERKIVLDALRRGALLAEAARMVDVYYQAILGRAKWDEDFAAALTAARAAGKRARMGESGVARRPR